MNLSPAAFPAEGQCAVEVFALVWVPDRRELLEDAGCGADS